LVKARCAIKRGFIKTPLHNFVTPTYGSIKVSTNSTVGSGKVNHYLYAPTAVNA
jgi:hypothetical protein